MAYTNSPLVDYTYLSPNNSGLRTNPINIITIHMVVGQCSVETLGYIFAPVSRQASSNYGIGPDGRIGLYCEEKNRSWCSSSSWNDNRAITIETASDTYYPYAVNYDAYESLIQLCADICKRNGKTHMIWYNTYDMFDAHYGEDNTAMYMTLHKWFSYTGCPGQYLEERMGNIAYRVNEILNPPVPEPEPEPEIIFSDVDPNSSLQRYIKWGIDNDIVKGFDDGTFRPDIKCTRAQFVVMLWRLMDKPEPKKRVEFKDSYFFGNASTAIQWAASYGLVQGYSSGYFGPDDAITRAQAAMILWRFAGKHQPNSMRSPFTDLDERLSTYKAILWGAENDIIKGYSDGTFKPNDPCLRSHAVIFLYRLATNLWV